MYNERQCLENELSIIRPIAMRAKLAALHHFKHRHDGRGNEPARKWIAEFRKSDRPATSARLEAIKAGQPMRNWCASTGQWI